MKFSAHIPLGVITPGQFQSMEAITEMGRALEAAGIDACHLTDHPAPDAGWLHANGHDALDPFTALAFVAAVTSKIMLHNHVVVLPYRNPFITAKAAATLQVLSGGRLILGVGGGYMKSEFEAVGVDFHKRGALTNEALEVMRLAWAGGPVTYKGMNFDAKGNEPRPAPDPQPLIWIGGGSDKAIERAARHGDGWAPFFAAPTLSEINRRTGIQSVEHLREKIVETKALRERLGKTAAFDFAIGTHQKPKELSRAAAESLLEEFDTFARAGVTWTWVDPPHASRSAYLEFIDWFGREVVASSN
jgi:probable F420-dependent oxidoreductase